MIENALLSSPSLVRTLARLLLLLTSLSLDFDCTMSLCLLLFFSSLLLKDSFLLPTFFYLKRRLPNFILITFPERKHQLFCHVDITVSSSSVFFLPEKMKSAREAIFWHFFGFFLGWKIIFSATFPKIFSGTLKFSRAQNDIFSRVEVRISRAKS